ncbi:hypothetical protein NPIL_339761 [Nephila pilipes]|uniref:Uncharacterized protein n=1 Tax=Nephila pilipes TaxID=299642 RepID=A0A8X6JYA4_NEPPI|nr:hypothetical protein NPIL_339761 [Nephila pilipes]
MSEEVLYNPYGESVLTLKEEIMGTQLTTVRYFRLAGEEDVGKSTLFARFKDSNGPQYNASTVIFFYNKSHFRMVVEYPISKRGEYLFFVDFEPAPDPSAEDAASFRRPVPLLDAILFCMDVTDQAHIMLIQERVATYKRYFRENMPPFLLVGTKADLRDDTLEEQLGMSITEKQILADFIGARGYCECSAWANTGINQLLQNIYNIIL